jgi:hypothetical protein
MIPKYLFILGGGGYDGLRDFPFMVNWHMMGTILIKETFIEHYSEFVSIAECYLSGFLVYGSSGIMRKAIITYIILY